MKFAAAIIISLILVGYGSTHEGFASYGGIPGVPVAAPVVAAPVVAAPVVAAPVVAAPVVAAPVVVAPVVETVPLVVPTPNLLTGLLAGVRTLLTAALSLLFNAINNLLLLIFKSLLFLLTLFLPANTVFQLSKVKDKIHLVFNYKIFLNFSF